MMEGAPGCDRGAQTAGGKEEAPQRGCFVKLMPELTWSGVHSLTPEILSSLISSRCLLLHFCRLPMTLCPNGGVLSFFMAPRTTE